MGKNYKYEKAYDKYNQAIKDYEDISKKSLEDAYTKSKQYVGDEGYKRSLELGKKGATSASNSAISQGISSARASGMNKAQASALGNQSAINAYNNQLNTQQNNAYQSGQDASRNEYDRANLLSGIYSNKSNLLGNSMSSQQAEGGNRYNRVWGTIGGIGSAVSSLGSLASDEKLKRYRDVSSCLQKNKDDILKYKINLSKYKGE